MILLDVIIRLRAACAIFEQRVSGTSAFAAATAENADIDVPCAFVVPMYKTGDPTSGNEEAQRVTERFAVIVALDNAIDKRHGRGLSTVGSLTSAENALTAALLGWTPPGKPHADTIRFGRSQHLFMNEARLWHQFEFFTSYYISSGANNADAALDAVINGNFPAVDPNKVRRLLAGESPDIGTGHEADYFTVIELLEDVSPAWIKVFPIPAKAEEPGLEMHGTLRHLEKPE